MGNLALIYYQNLYSILMPTCPFRTGNMKSHITFTQAPNYCIVKIEAPINDSKGALVYDYAVAVHEGLAAKAQNRAMSPKEARNYHWVQRAVKQAAELTAEKVTYSGGFHV